MEGCTEPYPRSTMEQDSIIQKKKCDITKMLVSKHSQQNPDGSDMFLAVSSVQLILI